MARKCFDKILFIVILAKSINRHILILNHIKTEAYIYLIAYIVVIRYCIFIIIIINILAMPVFKMD